MPGAAARLPDCTPHRFRHTYTTRLLRAGVDIRLVKELLGHEDIKSTMVYTEVTDMRWRGCHGGWIKAG